MTLRAAAMAKDATREGAPGDEALWHAFAAAAGDAQFCQAWLALLCRQLPQVSAAVVLLQAPEANTFLPAAVWPDAKRDLSFLSKVAERALTEGRGVLDRPETPGASTIHVAYPAQVGGRMVGAVVLEAAHRPEAQVHALLRQLHWGVAWLHDLIHRRERTAEAGKGERIGTAMEVVATALRRDRLQQVLLDVANHLATHMACSRVAIGLVNGATVKVAALSNAAWFESRAGIMTLYCAAMEDTLDARAVLRYERADADTEEALPVRESAHARLVRESGAQAVLSMPLTVGTECVAIVTLERDAQGAFDAADEAWLATVTGLLAAVIEQKRSAERGYLVRLGEDARALFARLFGSGHLVWKAGALAALACVLLLALVQIEYRVSAKTVVEGAVQRSAVAPFETFVAASMVRAGDVVDKGQVLCQLDDRELKLEQNRWRSERDQYSGKLREAMANHQLADIQILGAQLQQAEAQLALVTDRLARTTVRAPFDGVIISGDLSQLIGSPVEAGKKLFDIAPLQSYRVILQVDERDVRHLQAGQKGKLMISGVVGQPVALTVIKVTPVASAQDGRNFFRVEASLTDPPLHLRPGMEGVGKVDTGERGLWWILTHSFTDWLRLSLWTWLP